MKNLVYFPSFQPSSDEWLKFALLYIEEFNPIIPNRGFQHLTREYRRIMEETDLIEPYNPTPDQGERASIKAIEYLESMSRNRHRHSALFNEANVLRLFQNRRDMNFEIFTEKFSYYWRDYCLQHELGVETQNGISVHETLAFIYMTYLAEEIAFEDGKSIITDSQKFDHFLNFKRAVPWESRSRHHLAQGVISLAVPRNISNLTFEQLIRFRNQNRAKIRSFNNELSSALSDVENRVESEDFISRYNDIYSDLTSEIYAQGAGIVTIPLSTYLIFHDASNGFPAYLEKTLGALGILLTGRIALKGRWKEIASRHNCRKYLTNLTRLGS